jgi:hypothetical protein
MARIDFDTKNIGKNIANDAEFELPANIHAAPGQTLSLPQRYGINKGENPPIIFDRYPGWTDTDARTELEKLWTDDVWPARIQSYLHAAEAVKGEAAYRLSESIWEMDRALEVAEGDYTDAGVVTVMEKRADCRAKSNAREVKIKEALVARTHPDDWPDNLQWDCALGNYASVVEVEELHGIGTTKESLAAQAEDRYGITDPGSGL